MRSKRDTLPTGVPAARESTDRVAASTHPSSAEAASGPRRALLRGVELPAPWLEGLLGLWNELPIASGDRAVARAVIEALAAMLPDHAAGMCLVPLDGGAQEIVRTHEVSNASSTDPARLFPGFTYERAAEIESGGSTLHIAGEDAACDDEHGAIAALVARVATVARRGIELARMHAREVGSAAELRSLNAHMVQAEKLASLGQLAAGVVHELNNPLTSIVAYTDWLVRKTHARQAAGADHGDELDRLRRIGESAGRMLRFTRDLVSYARPSSETTVQVPLHHVIEQAIAFCEHVIADANVAVERRLAPQLPLVRGKPEQLAQIFVNLITNACHAMAPGEGRAARNHEAPVGAGGTLSVRTYDDGDFVRVEIADTGHGVLTEHLPHVFTPFFTTKTSGAGTGLGLAIVKSIVDGHHGTIRVSSEPGRGATFTITLPASLR